MRIDEIDLIGSFKLIGTTGNNSQAIGMSGGSTSWINVVSSGGSSQGLVQRSGYNYIIVEATGNAQANGNKLRTAYNDVVTLLGQIGTPAADNRVSILLTPGDYDLFGLLDISVSYIDIVGISQNPLDTIVRASDDLTTFSFSNPGLDFGLYNIDLRSGGTGQQVIFSDYGSGITYLRMKNVVLSGNGFWDGTTFYSFYDLDGEFEDITVLDGCYFALAYNSLSGTYKNIKIGDVAYSFYASLGTLTGTYKNITISNLTNTAFYGTSVSGIFEDIRINGLGNIFLGSLSGYYKNIISSGSSGTVFYQGPITGIYEDIEISTAGSVFQVTSGIDGTFKNIKIGDVTVGSIFSGSGNILGTYSNIEIGNVTTDVFYTSNSGISINIKDIKIGNVGGNAFRCDDGDLSGKYENITIGDVTTVCFWSAYNNVSGIFDTIQVRNVGNVFFNAGTNLSGNFKNIKAVDVTNTSFGSGGDLSGTYKNISINSTLDLFTSTNINGTFDDISVVSNSNSSFYAGSILFGTFSNIKVDSTSGTFNSGDVLGGYYDGITIGTSLGAVFNSKGSPVQGTFKNIKVTSCLKFLESSSTIQPTLVENIEVGECTTEGFITTIGGSLDGTYKNIKVHSVAGRAFRGGDGITGTYSNIEVGYCAGPGFLSDSGNINVNIDGIIINSAEDIFYTPSGQISTTSKINKLVANCLSSFKVTNRGKLTNSTIHNSGTSLSNALDLTGGSIERCKIITNTSADGIIGSGQVIYTMTNETISVTGIVSQNITDADITS